MINLTHPAVIDLYLAYSEQEHLSKVVDGYGKPENWPGGVSDAILDAALKFTDRHEKAIKALGSCEKVDAQMFNFFMKTGSA